MSDAREERSSAPKNWVDVVERLLELEGLVDADDREHENAVHAGLHTLIMEAYDDLEPIGDAPFEITGWEPDSDKQPEPDEPGGERTAPPAKMSTMVTRQRRAEGNTWSARSCVRASALQGADRA